MEVSYAMGAALLTRTNLFFRLGMFDEEYFFWFDDVDYGLRVWSAGYRNVCVLECSVYHIGSATFGRANPKLRYYFSRNLLLLLVKLPLLSILAILPVTILEVIFTQILHSLKSSDTLGLLFTLIGLKHFTKRLIGRKLYTRKIMLSINMLHHTITHPYVTARNLRFL